MPPRKSTSIKGTDDKAALHVQNTVARETVDRDSIQQLIAPLHLLSWFILSNPEGGCSTKSESSFFLVDPIGAVRPS